MGVIQVALRSPDRLLREALATSLATRPDLAVIGATERFSDLLWLCRLRPADVVLVDLGDEDDLDGVHALRATGPDVAIVLTYTALSAAALAAAERAGATRLVPHSRGIQAIIEAVAQGRASPRTPYGPALLTDRDLQVLTLMSAGYSVKEMARLMGVSSSTIENHKRRMFAKLSAHSQAHVVARAAQMGLLWSAPRGVPPPRQGNARVVLVVGAPGDLRDTVVIALLRHAIPVLVLGRDIPTAEDELLHFRDLVTVLVSGPDSDWRAVSALGTRTVTVIANSERPTIAEELIRGADAVVPANDVSEQLAFVVALASQGYATTDAAREMIRSMAARFPSVRASLTARELDILRSIARGHSVRQTAAALGITSKTVENTQARLFRKLSVRNRAEALAVAFSLGLITAD